MEITVSKNYLSDENNIDEIKYIYDSDKDYWFRKTWKMPWGLNKLETKKLLEFAEWNLIQERDDLLVYSSLYDVTTSFFFNNREQLYSINNSNYILYNDESSYGISAFQRLEGRRLKNEAYDDNYYSLSGPLIDISKKIYWTDKFGKIQDKTVEDFYHVDLLQVMNISEDYEYFYDDLILKNNIVLKSIKKWNSVNIEFTLRKESETRIISEFILTNTKLLD